MPVKNPFMKKRLESKLCSVLNLSNELQQLAKIKIQKLLEFQTKRVTNLREQKLKKQLTKTPWKQTKSMQKMSTSIFQCRSKSSLMWLANLWNHVHCARREEEKNCYLKFKSHRDILQCRLLTVQIYLGFHLIFHSLVYLWLCILLINSRYMIVVC